MRIRSVMLAVAILSSLPSQVLPDIRLRGLGGGGTPMRYAVQLPAQWNADSWAPLVLVFANGNGTEAATAAVASLGRDLPAAGFVVVSPLRHEHDASNSLRPVLAELRRVFRIEQGGIHVAFGGDPAHAVATVLAHRDEFQTVTAFGKAADADVAPLRRLPARRVHALETDAPADLAAHFTKLHAERTLPGAAGEVARVLDDFHDAAANGDEDRYFAILPEDAVFLGTDGTERWTGTEFRAFAMPSFQRDSAWTYVTLRRCVNLEPGEQIAWFDESFDNEAYGECRGSGVMCKRDGKWVLRQYHLTVPVPNDVTRPVAARIRAFQDGVKVPSTTIVFVRHAEKVDASPDSSLSDTGRARAAALAKVLRDMPFDTVYTSQYRRAAETVAPVCDVRSLTPTVVPAADMKGLVAKLRRDHASGTVLVCGHSNTVPELVQALGVTTKVTIGDDEFDRLFVVTLDADGARLLALRYSGVQ